MPSKVFFHDSRASSRRSRLEKVRDLFARADLAAVVAEGDRVAIKVHWGEPGNVAFLPPPYVRLIAEEVRKAGGLPYVTDANTLYVGMRRDAVQNLMAAAHNGYTPETLTAPLIVADGVKGRDGREVELPGTSLGKAKIASGILDADAMLVLSHVKSHMLMGFGGALKNLGMGCATPAGKQILHSDVRPRVEADKCRGDGACVRRCPVNCIDLVEREPSSGRAARKVARIDSARCIGCGECTAACPHEAIPVRWKTSAEAIQRKTAEYALGAVKDKPGKVGYLNFILQVTPDCDCCHWSDNAFVPDVGFLASTDPVAIDAASLDLVRAAPPLPGSRAEGCRGDPWRAVYDIDPNFILEHAEKIGLGTRDYKLVKL